MRKEHRQFTREPITSLFFFSLYKRFLVFTLQVSKFYNCYRSFPLHLRDGHVLPPPRMYSFSPLRDVYLLGSPPPPEGYRSLDPMGKIITFLFSHYVLKDIPGYFKRRYHSTKFTHTSLSFLYNHPRRCKWKPEIGFIWILTANFIVGYFYLFQ